MQPVIFARVFASIVVILVRISSAQGISSGDVPLLMPHRPPLSLLSALIALPVAVAGLPVTLLSALSGILLLLIVAVAILLAALLLAALPALLILLLVLVHRFTPLRNDFRAASTSLRLVTFRYVK
jgi:hypothetical protein